MWQNALHEFLQNNDSDVVKQDSITEEVRESLGELKEEVWRSPIYDREFQGAARWFTVVKAFNVLWCPETKVNVSEMDSFVHKNHCILRDKDHTIRVILGTSRWSINKLYRGRIPLHRPLWKIEVEKTRTLISVNATYLEYLVHKRKAIPNPELIVGHIKTHRYITLNQFSDASLPYQPVVKNNQPEGLSIPLYRYQSECVQWMIDQETGPQTLEFSPCVLLSSVVESPLEANVYVDPRLGRFYKEPVTTKVKYNGAILGDEMGLGKTIEVLALILANPQSKDTPYTQSYCSDFPRIRTKATLVLCPNHLVKQWATEAMQKTKLKVASFWTITMHRKISYQDIIDADIVVVSINFLINTNYMNVCTFEGANARNRNFDWELCKQDSAAIGFDVTRISLETKSPILHLFDWHRVVFDEAHDLVADNWLKNMLVDFRGVVFRWYVSGSPFPTTNVYTAAMEFVKRDKDSYEKYYNYTIYENLFDEQVHKKLFWRNTKKNVSHELQIPDYHQEVILIEPTTIEKALFHGAGKNRIRLQQLCCHPQISSEDTRIFGREKKPLSQIREEMMSHIVVSVEQIQYNIQDIKKQCAKKRSIIKENGTHSLKHKQAKQTLDDKLEQLKEAEDELKLKQQTLSFLSHAIPKTIQLLTDPCPICFELDTDNMAISTCGHMLCSECFSHVVSQSAKCPICRAPLKGADITLIDSEKKEQVVDKSDLDILIEKNGTKMGHLIHYINQTVKNEDSRVPCRFIVFSQWDNMLHLVGKTLSENGIPNVFVSGHPDQKNNAIHSFQTDKKMRVIMLSLQNAASGTNLTQATHIIFTDPVEGSEESRRATDQQAIGRAHRIGQTKQVNIVRFILKGTIEEEIFNTYSSSETSNIVDLVNAENTDTVMEET